MKKILCVIALILTLTVAVSCSKTVPNIPEGMKEASNDTVEYDLFIPDNWTVETSTGVITAKRSDSVLANVSMMASTSTEGISTVADYWAQYTEAFKSTFTDFELIEENAQVLLDGHEAGRYVYKGTVAGSVPAQYQQIVCLKDGVIYLFTYTAAPDKYEEYLPDVEEILEHFSFHD